MRGGARPLRPGRVGARLRPRLQRVRGGRHQRRRWSTRRPAAARRCSRSSTSTPRWRRRARSRWPASTARARSPSTPRSCARAARRPASCASARPIELVRARDARAQPTPSATALCARSCAASPRSAHRRARDGRRPRDARPAARARGQRRPGRRGSSSPFWITPESSRGRLGGSSSPQRDARGRRWRGGVAKFFIDGVIDSGTGWLYEPDTRGRRARAVLARPGALPPARSRCFARARLPVRDARHRRPRRARGARRLPRRRRGARRAPPDRAHRDAAAARPAAVRGRGRRRLDAGAAHDGAASPTARQLVAAAGRRSAASRAFPIRSLRESGALVALGSDWPVARFDPRDRDGGGAAAPRRRASAERAPYDDQAIDGLDRAGGLHDRARRSPSARRHGSAGSRPASRRPDGLRRGSGRVRPRRPRRPAGAAHGRGRRDRVPLRWVIPAARASWASRSRGRWTSSPNRTIRRDGGTDHPRFHRRGFRRP